MKTNKMDLKAILLKLTIAKNIVACAVLIGVSSMMIYTMLTPVSKPQRTSVQGSGIPVVDYGASRQMGIPANKLGDAP